MKQLMKKNKTEISKKIYIDTVSSKGRSSLRNKIKKRKGDSLRDAEMVTE